MDLSPAALDFMVNHIVLPPKLPQADDTNHKYELALVEFARDQAVAFQKDVSPESRSCWAGIVKMLTTWLKVNAHGSISKTGLMKSVAALNLQGSYSCICFVSGIVLTLANSIQDTLALHIRCQNAGLILRKVADGVMFECFEVMPLAEAVMASKGSLRRTFPGRAILVSAETFNDPRFVEELTSFIHRLDSEQVDDMSSKTTKAKSEVMEERDSSSPKLVTELLFAILAPYGKFVTCRSIPKRNRDDVCWSNARLPWRRSPVWLVCKVAIELFLVNSGLENASCQYKNYMILLTAKLSEVARMHGLSSEFLFVINAKAARRASKIAGKIFDFVESFALDSVRLSRKKIEECVMATRNADSLQVKTIVPSFTDTALFLKTSKPHLTNALERQLNPVDQEEFSPLALSRLSCSYGNLPSPKSLLSGEDSSMLVLADFETWVRDDLRKWLQGSEDMKAEWVNISENLTKRHNVQDCQTLTELISAYKSAATDLYKEHPEYLSLMLLTILELWCSLDILATQSIPILNQYSPEIRTSIIQPLLLPQREHLIRLQQIESYLEMRHQQVILSWPSVFGEINSKSLSVQYFNACKELQDLRIRIERDAATAKEDKRKELESLNSLYNSLIEEANTLSHLQKINRRGREYHPTDLCRRCGIERKANNIHISVHEWPLPDSEDQAKAAVFELRCPT